jgi:hypothetical protein
MSEPLTLTDVIHKARHQYEGEEPRHIYCGDIAQEVERWLSARVAPSDDWIRETDGSLTWRAARAAPLPRPGDFPVNMEGATLGPIIWQSAARVAPSDGLREDVLATALDAPGVFDAPVDDPEGLARDIAREYRTALATTGQPEPDIERTVDGIVEQYGDALTALGATTGQREGLDVERLARAFANVGFALHEETWYVTEYSLPEVAAEYAHLRATVEGT